MRDIMVHANLSCLQRCGPRKSKFDLNLYLSIKCMYLSNVCIYQMYVSIKCMCLSNVCVSLISSKFDLNLVPYSLIRLD